MNEQKEYHKHPDTTLDIRISWLNQLQRGERIMRSQWSALGLTVVAQQIVADDAVTVAWIAGGLGYTRYMVTNTIMTTLGRQYSQTLTLHVSDDVPVAESGL